MITLTQQERDKFASWLEQGVQADDIIAKQLEQMGSPEILIKHIKQRVAASSIVANELRKIEDMSIGG